VHTDARWNYFNITKGEICTLSDNQSFMGVVVGDPHTPQLTMCDSGVYSGCNESQPGPNSEPYLRGVLAIVVALIVSFDALKRDCC
jgi:hypothetical protein